MQVDLIDRFTPDLDAFAVDSKDATFYHSGTWIESLSQSFPRMTFQCFVARSGNEILGYLPFFIIKKGPLNTAWSLPFGTYGGPVVGDDPDVADALVESFRRLKNRGGIHEVGLVDFTGRFARGLGRQIEETTHILELEDDFDSLRAGRFKKSKRRQARKARREGVRVEEARTPDEVSKYHGIYARRTAEWGERFTYPEEFFVKLFEKGNGRVRLFLAWEGDDLVGGHLNFYFKDTVIAWNGVTASPGSGSQASTLLYNECIRHACENGFRFYNLGGSLGKRSLIEYKESIGGVLFRYQTGVWRSLGGKVASALKGFVPGR
jgi:CelD/BcsL family acetyltransferase involved in cellulose biosynthesis